MPIDMDNLGMRFSDWTFTQSKTDTTEHTNRNNKDKQYYCTLHDITIKYKALQ